MATVQVLGLLKRFMAGEMDSYEFMPQLMTLRKQAEKIKLARGGSAGRCLNT